MLKLNKKYYFKVFLTTLFLLSSLTLYFYMSPTWAFEFLPCRTWQFMAGILGFYFERIFTLKNDHLNKKLSLLDLNKKTFTCFYSIANYFLILLLLAVFFFKLSDRLINVSVIFATSFLLFLGSFDGSNLLLSNFLLVWIGDLSYTVYLIHWPIIQLFRYLSIKLAFGLTGR